MQQSHKVPKLVTAPEALANLCEALKQEAIIALDTEFIRETTFFPKIALIQVATQKEAWLIDPTVLDKDALAPLLAILTQKDILKVIHASYADQECLYWAYGCIVDPVLDTSVAAALCGRGDNVGLQKLLKDELGVNIPKGRSRVKWLARPLADELLIYAEEDVLHLVDLGLSLKNSLEKLSRWDWVIEESQVSQEQFDVTPEIMAQKMGKNSHLDATGRSVLLELVTWRESRAKTKNVPRHWVMDNEILLSLSKVRPRSIDELKTFRGLNAKEVERSGEDILKLVKLGIASAKSNPHEESRPAHRGPQIETHLVNLVQSYVALLAREHSIANRYLLNVAQIEWLLREAHLSVSQWVQHGILSRRASMLIGTELKALLDGHVGLVISHGTVKVVPIPSKGTPKGTALL